MDLEAESIVSIDTGMSSDIAESCNKLLDVQKKISTAEEEMKKLKEVETTQMVHLLKLSHSIQLEYQHLKVNKLLIGSEKMAMEI